MLTCGGSYPLVSTNRMRKSPRMGSKPSRARVRLSSQGVRLSRVACLGASLAEAAAAEAAAAGARRARLHWVRQLLGCWKARIEPIVASRRKARKGLVTAAVDAGAILNTDADKRRMRNDAVGASRNSLDVWTRMAA